MILYRIGTTRILRAPAKLNLFFEVHGKRPDGFHEITSLALPVGLFDTLTFEPTPDDRIDFRCHGGGDDIARDEANIVVRALLLLKRAYPQAGGARVRLFKGIPSQAGLGGGSSDAVAALIAAREAWRLDLSPDALRETAAELGSDCPIFLQRGASLARGRGERIESLGPIPRLHFVILKPVAGLSTAQVYRDCMSRHDGRFRDVRDVRTALLAGHWTQAGRLFFNRLETAAAALWPDFERIRREMGRLDCLAVRMSGSGTAFYGLCRSARHAEIVARRLRAGRCAHEKIYRVSSF